MAKERATDCHRSPSLQQLGDVPGSKLIEPTKQQLTLNQNPDVPPSAPRYDFVLSCLAAAGILYLDVSPCTSGC